MGTTPLPTCLDCSFLPPAMRRQRAEGLIAHRVTGETFRGRFHVIDDDPRIAGAIGPNGSRSPTTPTRAAPAFWRGSRISGPCRPWSAEGLPRLQSVWAF